MQPPQEQVVRQTYYRNYGSKRELLALLSRQGLFFLVENACAQVLSESFEKPCLRHFSGGRRIFKENRFKPPLKRACYL